MIQNLYLFIDVDGTYTSDIYTLAVYKMCNKYYLNMISSIYMDFILIGLGNLIKYPWTKIAIFHKGWYVVPNHQTNNCDPLSYTGDTYEVPTGGRTVAWDDDENHASAAHFCRCSGKSFSWRLQRDVSMWKPSEQSAMSVSRGILWHNSEFVFFL